MTASMIARALGGRKTLRTDVRRMEQLQARILNGLPYGAFEAITSHYGLERPLVTEALQVPERTLARRKQTDRFAAEESDRLARLARIAALAEETLGSAEKAGRWLQKPNRALRGAVPIRQLATDAGAQQVEHVLTRIARGVLS